MVGFKVDAAAGLQESVVDFLFGGVARARVPIVDFVGSGIFFRERELEDTVTDLGWDAPIVERRFLLGICGMLTFLDGRFLRVRLAFDIARSFDLRATDWSEMTESSSSAVHGRYLRFIELGRRTVQSG